MSDDDLSLVQALGSKTPESGALVGNERTNNMRW